MSAYAFGVSGVEGLVLIRIVYYRGLNNYQYYIGGSLFSLQYVGPQSPILIMKAPFSGIEGLVLIRMA